MKPFTKFEEAHPNYKVTKSDLCDSNKAYQWDISYKDFTFASVIISHVTEPESTRIRIYNAHLTGQKSHLYIFSGDYEQVLTEDEIFNIITTPLLQLNGELVGENVFYIHALGNTLSEYEKHQRQIKELFDMLMSDAKTDLFHIKTIITKISTRPTLSDIELRNIHDMFEMFDKLKNIYIPTDKIEDPKLVELLNEISELKLTFTSTLAKYYAVQK